MNEWFLFESYFDKRLYGKVECNIYVKDEIIAQIYHISNWTDCLISDQIFKNTVPVLKCRELLRMCPPCSRNRWKTIAKWVWFISSSHCWRLSVSGECGDCTTKFTWIISDKFQCFWPNCAVCFHVGLKMWVNLHWKQHINRLSNLISTFWFVCCEHYCDLM